MKITDKLKNKDKDILVMLVGPSGSGKTTLQKGLKEKGYNIIQSYTTREPREENEWGHTFLSRKTLLKDTDTKDVKFNSYKDDPIIALVRMYNGDFYFATESQYKGKGVSVYTIDPNGEKQLRERFKNRPENEPKIITVYLSVCKDICKKRMMKDLTRSEQDIEIRAEQDVKRFENENYKYIINAKQNEKVIIKEFENIIKKYK